MIITFLEHGWKKFARSVSFSREMATTLFLVFLGLMVSGYLLALGFALPAIITGSFGQTEAVLFLNRFLLYYFIVEFFIRYMLQNIPVLDIQPYLLLPIKRSRIIHFLLTKSLFHVMNLFVLMLFTPFAFKTVAAEYTIQTAWIWMVSLWLISITIHYLVILYKVKLDDTFWGIFSLVLVFSLIGAADYYNFFKLTDVSSLLFSMTLSGPFFLIFALLLAAGVYAVNYRIFSQSVYIDELVKERSAQFGQGRDFGFLKNLGLTGDLITLELKLIFRNKRPRTILFLSALFLFYGLIFYRDTLYTEQIPAFLLFVGIFISGIFMINYGQYLYSWQASHFDFTLTHPISLRQYIESKYWLLFGITLICFLFTIPYLYFGWKILFINIAMLLFNLGVNIFIILNLAMWRPKKLDLKKGGAFNIEGAGAAQWVMGIPLFLGPYVIYLPFSFAGFPNAGIVAVACVGLVGIVLRPLLINLTVRRMLVRKHPIASGFRKD